MEGAPIHWYAFEMAAREGRFMHLLAKLPRERWAERNENGETLLHYACCGRNVAAVVAAVVALLQSGLVDVNARNEQGITPVYYAVSWNQTRAVEILCVMGADLRARNEAGYAPIDIACIPYISGTGCGETLRVLVANGVRLSTAREINRETITPEPVAFEQDVLRCRAAVASILSVERKGNLWRWDKLLLREIAYAVWATRYKFHL